LSRERERGAGKAEEEEDEGNGRKEDLRVFWVKSTED